jgi:aminoglycoside phosphotransferase (APT) family kinase protein
MYSSKTALELIHKTLTEVINPHLKDKHARALMGIVLQATEQLINREGQVPEKLKSYITEGVVLATSMTKACPDQSIADMEKDLTAIVVSDNDTGFQFLARQYDKLTKILAELTTYLAEQKPSEQRDRMMYEAAKWEENVFSMLLEPLSVEPHFEPTHRPLTREKLQTFLDTVYIGENRLTVTDFDTASGGMSKVTYLFRAQDVRGNSHGLVARQNGSKPTFTIDCFIVNNEFDVVKDLYQAGYLVPEPLVLAENLPDVDGDFYLLKQVPGSTIGSVFDGVSDVSEDILLQLADLFAELHSLPMSAFSNYIDKHCDSRTLQWRCDQLIRHDLLRWRNYLANYPKSPSVVDNYLDFWLYENIPSNNEPPVLVHGDMSIHNLLVNQGRITAVLDWEVAHFGHPAEDLTYVREMVSARMDWDKFMTRYHESGGRAISQEIFDYYEVLGYRTKVIAANFQSTLVDRRTTDDIRNLGVAMEYHPKFIARAMAPIRDPGNGP